jgi:hypothetical protein
MLQRHVSILAVLLSAPVCGLLQGCGGGFETVASDAQVVRSNASIRIEGCVVDEHFIPNEGVAVRALSPDGRALAQATSGRRGEVTVSVPAGVPVALVVDREGGERMSVPPQDRDSVLGSCLVAGSLS